MEAYSGAFNPATITRGWSRMSAFCMQVACGCGLNGPIGMDQLHIWDGEEHPSGFVEGRRYIWHCPECGNQVCVNMKLIEEDSE
jgi:hypothetical protein